jgi:hypothetical protein
MCPLVVRTNIIDYYACWRPAGVAKEATEQWLQCVSVPLSATFVEVKRLYCVRKNVVPCVCGDHERSIFHDAGVARGPGKHMRQLLLWRLRHGRGTSP